VPVALSGRPTAAERFAIASTDLQFRGAVEEKVSDD
jgi:hypothetical protein